MQFCLLDSPQKCYNCINRTSIFFQHPKEVFVCSLIVSLRCVFWVGLSIQRGGIDSPRPASQRAAAFILTAAMLTTLAAPAFAKTWHIEDGDITVKAGETKGTNKVSQGANQEVEDTDTIITNRNEGTSSSNTVTIEAEKKDDKVEVTLKDVNIDTSSRKKAAVSVTGEGDTNIKLNGDNALKSDIYRSGIYGRGSLTISGGENDSLTAQGGAGGSGIHISRNGSLTISGGTVTANGDDGGSGIYSSNSSSVTISGGTVTATGGGSTGSNGLGGRGICSDSGGVTISGGTVKATGGNGDYSGGDGISSSDRVAISGSTVTANGGDSSSRNGGSGISSSSGVTVSDGTVTANGGNGGNVSGDGIRSDGGVTISGGTVKAAGGDSKDGYGGDGIRSGGGVTISGNTVNAAGGNGGKVGGYGICSFDRVAISGGTVEAAGGDSKDGYGGDGIYSNDIDLSGSLELTAKAGSPNGKALSRAGRELELDTIKDKLGPGAKVTATDADGKVIDQVPTPRPVEPEGPVIPEESSSSSGGGSAAPFAPVFSLPGLTVTDKSGAVIDSISTQSGNTLTVCVGRLTASFRISLAALRQLRAEGIETITFQTILCSTTLSVDELLAMGGEDAEIVLTHHIRSSTLTVGGKAV